MSILKEIRIGSLGSAESKISFTTTGGENWEAWDRFLTIDGKQAYHIGNICNTCDFFFERLGGANQVISAPEAVESLTNGIQSLKDRAVLKWDKVLPLGEYQICLFDIQPVQAQLGQPSDYFANEQIELFGLDTFYGIPHHPKVSYYRLDSSRITKNGQLFEFLVPMFPQSWLKDIDTQRYIDTLNQGQMPTAVSISILDIKAPAMYQDENPVHEHWCLTHYLLDGHHKAYAASKTSKPITLLSFLTSAHGISDASQIQQVIKFKMKRAK